MSSRTRQSDSTRRRRRDPSTVFVVDDEAAVRRAVSKMLAAAGFEVETFESAEAFLEAYDGSRPGCAILDVRMPGMDGMELQQHLDKHRLAIPFIILTGHGDVPMAVQAMESGAVTFLQKPVQANVLIEKVSEALRADRRARSKAAESGEIQSALAMLTPRENEVLELLVQGKKLKTIARALGTAESTVRSQRASILKKMQADSVTDLLRMVIATDGE